MTPGARSDAPAAEGDAGTARRRRLPERPALTTQVRLRGTPPSPALRRRWTRQPLLGLAGLSLVVPVAVLVAVGAGGAEPSVRVLGPIVTFGLPIVVMVAFWWEDWPGTRLGPNWAGWADTVLITVGAVALTVLGQAAAVGHVDVRGVLEPFPGAGHSAVFPDALPLAGVAFIAMLQLTLVSEGWPLRRLGPLSAGACAVAVSWVVALLAHVLLLGGRPFSGAGPDAGSAVVTGEQLGALLTVVGAWQVWFFLVWRGWPFAELSRRGLRLVAGNAVVLGAAALTDAVLFGSIGLDAPTISALAGCFVAGGLLVGMLFEGAVRVRASQAGERAVVLLLVLVCAAGLYLLLDAYAGSLRWSTVSAEDWIGHAALNAIGVAVILHVAIGRRWPFALPATPPRSKPPTP